MPARSCILVASDTSMGDCKCSGALHFQHFASRAPPHRYNSDVNEVRHSNSIHPEIPSVVSGDAPQRSTVHPPRNLFLAAIVVAASVFLPCCAADSNQGLHCWQPPAPALSFPRNLEGTTAEVVAAPQEMMALHNVLRLPLERLLAPQVPIFDWDDWLPPHYEEQAEGHWGLPHMDS